MAKMFQSGLWELPRTLAQNLPLSGTYYLAYITLEEKEIADLEQWFAQHGLAPMDDSEDVKSEVDEKKAKAEQEVLKAKEAAARKAADEAAAIAWEQVYTKFMAGEEGKVPDERPTQIKEEPQDDQKPQQRRGPPQAEDDYSDDYDDEYDDDDYSDEYDDDDYSDEEDSGQAMQQYNRGGQTISSKDQPAPPPPKIDNGSIGRAEGKKTIDDQDGLKLKLDVNLDIEVELKARIHGDLTLALL